MKPSCACLAVLSALLAACATPAPAPDRAAAAVPLIDSGHLLTGSRIPSRRPDKLAGRSGAQDDKETMQTMPAPLPSR